MESKRVDVSRAEQILNCLTSALEVLADDDPAALRALDALEEWAEEHGDALLPAIDGALAGVGFRASREPVPGLDGEVE